MMFAVVSSEEFFCEFEKLNYSKIFELTKIQKKNMLSLTKELEADNSYDLIFLDTKELNIDNESMCRFLERLNRTKGYRIVVIASGYLSESAFVKDMLESGAKHVITSEIVGLKKEILDILVLEGLWGTKKAGADKASAFLLGKESVPTTNNDTGNIEQKQEAPEVRPVVALDTSVIPPSQVPRSVAKARIPKKPVPKPETHNALSIAFAGAGGRIGTTTQVMQLALFLLSRGESVAVMQIFGDNKLDSYVGITNSVLVDKEHYRIDGIDLFRSGKYIAKVKAKFDYILFDYGDFNSLSDVTSFLDKDICVIVGGIKPSEINQLDNIFDYDDGSLFYIFSFVPKSDMQSVLSQMEASAEKTFFAAYAPDYWQYCGDDEIYSSLVDRALKPSTSKKKTKVKTGILSKIPFLNF